MEKSQCNDACQHSAYRCKGGKSTVTLILHENRTFKLALELTHKHISAHTQTPKISNTERASKRANKGMNLVDKDVWNVEVAHVRAQVNKLHFKIISAEITKMLRFILSVIHHRRVTPWLARSLVCSFLRSHASRIGKANNILKAEPNSKNQQVQAA